MAEQAAPDVNTASKADQTLSQLLARILQQLSLSAWFPSAALLTTIVFLVETRLEEGDVLDAIRDMASPTLGQLALAIGGVVVGTVLTQAFEFEAIRILEGYWGHSRLADWFASPMVKLQISRRNRLRDLRDKLYDQARESALPGVRETGGEDVARIFKDRTEDESVDHLVAKLRKTERAKRKKAASIPWKELADPSYLRRRQEVTDRLKRIPLTNDRVMPTRLGNTLRAAEDRAVPQNEDSESFVLRHFEGLSASMRIEHDDYRTRLDLYCTMTFVALTSGLLGAAIWQPLGLTYSAGVAAVFILFTALMLRAAVAAAEGYGVILEQIGRKVKESKEE